MRYVLMFVETEEYARDLEAMSDEDRDRAYALVGRWFMENSGKIVGHSKLRPPDATTTVRLDGGGSGGAAGGRRGEPVVLDGPFVEGKEVVSGVAEVEVEDLDEALRIVGTWPGCPVVEIRPVQPVAGLIGGPPTGSPAGPPTGPPVGGP